MSYLLSHRANLRPHHALPSLTLFNIPKSGISRHRCPHGTPLDDTFVTETTTIEKTAYQKDFDKKVTSTDTVRLPAIKPVDNLRPEGTINFVHKQPFQPAEKVTPTRPHDNLFVTGDFDGIRRASLSIANKHFAEKAQQLMQIISDTIP